MPKQNNVEMLEAPDPIPNAGNMNRKRPLGPAFDIEQIREKDQQNFDTRENTMRSRRVDEDMKKSLHHVPNRYGPTPEDERGRPSKANRISGFVGGLETVEDRAVAARAAQNPE